LSQENLEILYNNRDYPVSINDINIVRECFDIILKPIERDESMFEKKRKKEVLARQAIQTFGAFARKSLFIESISE
jgi:hypothetical protein